MGQNIHMEAVPTQAHVLQKKYEDGLNEFNNVAQKSLQGYHHVPCPFECHHALLQSSLILSYWNCTFGLHSILSLYQIHAV